MIMPSNPPGSARAETPADVTRITLDAVQRWVDHGIISPEQAEAIRADLAATPSPRPEHPGPGLIRTSLVSEALGYLGGALVLVALGLGASRFWPDLSTAARLAGAALVAAGLLAAGQAVPSSAGPVGERLRSVLWLLATGCFAGFLAILSDEVIGWHNDRLPVFVAAGTVLLAIPLWWRHHQPLQHAAVLISLATAAGTATALLPGAGSSPGASVWAVGVAWYLLGWGGVLGPRREVELAGAALTAFAALLFGSEPWGSPLALLTLVVLASLAVRLRDLLLLAIAALATVLVLPAVITHYFHGVLAAASVLLLVGAALVGAAIVTVRRQHQERAPAAPRWTRGTAPQGWTGAGLVLAVTAAAVLVVALT